MIIKELLARKRDGGTLDPAELGLLTQGIASGAISEGQIAAFAMAVCCRGLSDGEQVALTLALRDSGRILDWRGLAAGRPVLDKHSTGGVGDKVSLMLAPIMAAAGGLVPMISGRGLGHTGGTLDKLAAIPGYNTAPSIPQLQQIAAEIGCVIIGQTDELVPADRRLYAVRDATGTVESVPLITASILSKKLAAGLDGLVMDVKAGSGAFMPDQKSAHHLARSLVDVAAGAGLRVTALVTDMNEVLGDTAGNALEVTEAVAYLTGKRREARLDRVTRALAVEMVLLGRLAPDRAQAAMLIETVLTSGAAAQCFARMVTALGGPADLLERPGEILPQAPVIRPVPALASGYVGAVDGRQIGLAVLALGGGRQRVDDVIDPAVGLSAIRGIGAEIGPDLPLAMVHARDEAAASAAISAVQRAVTITPGRNVARPIILERVISTVSAFSAP